MRKSALFIVVIVLTLPYACACAEEGTGTDMETVEGGVKIRKGMEVKKMGDANIIVPKGAELTRRGAEVHVEASDEWAARRIDRIEERISALEQGQKALKEQIKKLTSAIGSVGKMNKVLRSDQQKSE